MFLTAMDYTDVRPHSYINVDPETESASKQIHVYQNGKFLFQFGIQIKGVY